MAAGKVTSGDNQGNYYRVAEDEYDGVIAKYAATEELARAAYNSVHDYEQNVFYDALGNDVKLYARKSAMGAARLLIQRIINSETGKEKEIVEQGDGAQTPTRQELDIELAQTQAMLIEQKKQTRELVKELDEIQHAKAELYNELRHRTNEINHLKSWIDANLIDFLPRQMVGAPATDVAIHFFQQWLSAKKSEILGGYATKTDPVPTTPQVPLNWEAVTSPLVEDLEQRVAGILEQRGNMYGDKYENHEIIGQIWGALITWSQWEPGQPLTASLVALLQVALKICRASYPDGRDHQDNYDDMIGYAKIADLCAKRELENFTRQEKEANGD